MRKPRKNERNSDFESCVTYNTLILTIEQNSF